MGNRNNHGASLSDYDIRLISEQTQLPSHVAQQLFEAFMERAGKDGRMSMSDFKRAYTEMNPHANIFNLDNDAERVFMMFDRDRNGVLTFDEFLMAYLLLQRGGNDVSTRWQSVINSMPLGSFSRPGYFNSSEALQLLHRLGQFYQIPNFDPIAQHNFVWSQLMPQIDPAGYIPQSEYIRVLASQPNIQPYL